MNFLRDSQESVVAHKDVGSNNSFKPRPLCGLGFFVAFNCLGRKVARLNSGVMPHASNSATGNNTLASRCYRAHFDSLIRYPTYLVTSRSLLLSWRLHIGSDRCILCVVHLRLLGHVLNLRANCSSPYLPRKAQRSSCLRVHNHGWWRSMDSALLGHSRTIPGAIPQHCGRRWVQFGRFNGVLYRWRHNNSFKPRPLRGSA